MSKRRCDKCEFWKDHDPKCINSNPHKDDKNGKCKRYPPVFESVETLRLVDGEHWDGAGSEVDIGCWEQPSTYAANWCGEFKHK